MTDGSERRVFNSTSIGVSSVVVGLICDSSSIGRALASQAKGCGIVLRLSLKLKHLLYEKDYSKRNPFI